MTKEEERIIAVIWGDTKPEEKSSLLKTKAFLLKSQNAIVSNKPKRLKIS